MHDSSRLRCAIRSLYEESAEFRFDYPLTIMADAGSKNSLAYYVFKYQKTPPFRTVIRLDSSGIARVWNRITGIVYRPGFIAMYGLNNLNLFLRTRQQKHLDVFLNHVNWLEQHAVIRNDRAVVWPHNFDLSEGPVRLRGPWISSNVQGLVMSALVRAWRITRRPRLLDLLAGSFRVFQLDCRHNGVRVEAEGHVVYSEVPGLAAPGVMDGFMSSLLGLYDVYVETGDATVKALFDEGVDGLRYFLPRWNYRDKWSWYSNHAYLSPPSYNCLNRLLLSVLGGLTHESRFADYAEVWNPDHLSALDRAEIYLAFLVTKNACRVRYRAWRQHPPTTLATTPTKFPVREAS
jgi:hypothetical protein